ncbi:MAG: protein kinase [Acidobacteria bacterium]|nr:protein kinase [Acidobacteriota bacterium]
MIGKTLSHYKVIEKIGQGGMGEVYRAEDTSLKREVAIKVLPEQFTKDPQRLARFEREAQLLAQLNHPNIAAIYGFEKADGVHFLALELVEGETLAERVAKGAVPVEEALEVLLKTKGRFAGFGLAQIPTYFGNASTGSINREKIVAAALPAVVVPFPAAASLAAS